MTDKKTAPKVRGRSNIFTEKRVWRLHDRRITGGSRLFLQGTLNDALPAQKRQHMRVNRAKCAILAELIKLCLRQIVQFFLVNRHIVSDFLLLADRITRCITWLEGYGFGFKQIHTFDDTDEVHRRAALALELLTKLNRIIGEFGRLAILEERDFGLVRHHRGLAIDAEQEAVAIIIIGKHKRITPNEGGQIKIWIHCAIVADEEVFILTHAHHGDRGQIITDKNNRIGHGRRAKFGYRHRYRMGLAKKGEGLINLFYPKTSMLLRIERLRILVEHDLARQFWLLGWIRCIFHKYLRFKGLAGFNGNGLCRQAEQVHEVHRLQDFHIGGGGKARIYVSHWYNSAINMLVLCLLCVLAACGGNVEPDGVTRQDLRESQNILRDFMLTELRLDPVGAIAIGLDAELPDTANLTFGDVSQAGLERRRLIRLELLSRLRQRPRLPAQRQLAQDLEIAAIQLARLIALEQTGQADASTGHADIYSVHPFTGLWRQAPSVLSRYHTIDTVAEAQAYLVRMAALADTVEDIKRRVRADALTGRGPPKVLIQETVAMLEQLLTPPSVELQTVTDVFANLLVSVPDLSSVERMKLQAQSAELLTTLIVPAYTNLLLELRSQLDTAPAQTGLWAHPTGADLYRRLLALYDAMDIPPERLHTLAARAVNDAQAQLQNALRATQPLPSDPAIEAEPNAALRDMLAAIYQMPTSTALSFGSQNDMREMPNLPVQPRVLNTEVVARTSFAGAAEIADLPWPEMLRRELRSLSQTAIFTAADAPDPARRLMPFTPLQRAFQLYQLQRSNSNAVTIRHLLLFETVLAAADTGLHHKRWSFEQTVDYIATTGLVDNEIAYQASLWLVTYPGLEAAKFELWQQLLTLSVRARAVSPRTYDEADFQNVIRARGPRPLVLIERDIEAWYNTLLENN